MIAEKKWKEKSDRREKRRERRTREGEARDPNLFWE